MGTARLVENGKAAEWSLRESDEANHGTVAKERFTRNGALAHPGEPSGKYSHNVCLAPELEARDRSSNGLTGAEATGYHSARAPLGLMSLTGMGVPVFDRLSPKGPSESHETVAESAEEDEVGPGSMPHHWEDAALELGEVQRQQALLALANSFRDLLRVRRDLAAASPHCRYTQGDTELVASSEAVEGEGSVSESNNKALSESAATSSSTSVPITTSICAGSSAREDTGAASNMQEQSGNSRNAANGRVLRQFQSDSQAWASVAVMDLADQQSHFESSQTPTPPTDLAAQQPNLEMPRAFAPPRDLAAQLVFESPVVREELHSGRDCAPASPTSLMATPHFPR